MIICVHITIKTVEILSVVGTAVATFFLAYIANDQLKEFNKTQSAQFLYNFKNDFFTEETRIIFQLIDAGWLEYIKNTKLDDSYFKVRIEKIDASNLANPLKDKLKKTLVYSTYEIDDLLIGHFEDLGIFWKKGVFKKEMLDDEFGYFIIKTWDDPDIKEYIEQNRKEDISFYERFHQLYNLLKDKPNNDIK